MEKGGHVCHTTLMNNVALAKKEKSDMIEKKQILVVEDNELNRVMLSEILSDEYKVLEAENGQKALEILKQNKDRVMLVLLDVMMPVMDGYTFLKTVKKDPELALIPVIVMTQSDSEEDEVAALTHGATDFVPKPYRPRVILNRVNSIIKLRESAALVNQFKYDRLTGLYSKEFFYRKVKERLEEDPDEDYTIICSNLENFKLYNDAFGQQAGDQLLQKIAVQAQNMISDGICGRYSADRFLFLQKSKLERKYRDQFIQEINNNHPEKFKNISMKWGIYEIVDRSILVEQMCDRALLAVDSIKGQYNQYFSVYDDALRGKLLREKAITDAMVTALDEGQFTIYYQPKYSLIDECIAGAEALVRWNHPEWGFMSPGEFIPLFEKNGFISRLDQYVWEQVCAQLKKWREAGYPPFSVSVNVSRTDIYHSQLVETLSRLTEKYEVDPKYLHLEITESVYTENPQQMISTIDKLRQLGFIIEMDDFGSGYSSLNMLGQIKLDILKLDMKFIQNEMEKAEEKSILKDIINMAHRLHLSVVAEGVETQYQMKRLQSMGCDYVQGYYFAKPMPADQFEELWKNQKSSLKISLSENSHTETSDKILLVVDDDILYRKKVNQIFEEQYQIIEASDVMSAMDHIRSYGCDISTIILSMTLPDEGAGKLLKALRQNPSYWKIPVLATIPRGEKMEELSLALETDDFLCKCHPIFDLRKRVEHLMEMKFVREQVNILQDEACRDYLTGLLNRRGLQAALASLRKEEHPLAFFLFDLDNLKIVNDTFGHDMGDRMIQSFADLLRRQTRNEDIQCRYGGDEFVVILKQMKDSKAAKKKGTEICQLFKEHFAFEHIPAACTCGIVMCESDDKPTIDLIEKADQALYFAKRENKGNCSIWGIDIE